MRIKDFKLFESRSFKAGGPFVVEKILNVFKERIATCKEIATDLGYKVISELMEDNNYFKVQIVLENVTEPADDKTSLYKPENFNQAQFSKLYQTISMIRPSVENYTGKRFLSRADVRSFDMVIEEWQKSEKLSKVNQTTGILEARVDYPEYVCIEVWMDF